MLHVMLQGVCCLVLTVVVAFGLLREDRDVLAFGAVGWALAVDRPPTAKLLQIAAGGRHASAVY